MCPSGKCAANFRTDELNMDAPKELLGLDVLHKRSTARNVEAMGHGRFNTAPRGESASSARARLLHAHALTRSHGPLTGARLPFLLSLRSYCSCFVDLRCACARCGARGAVHAEFFGEVAVRRSNYSVPSRLFLDPYHVADGNLWSENFLMGRFQRGGMTSLAGRSSQLVLEKERFGKEDMQSRARSKYLEPEGGRFVPPLKPACARDKGPDPYGTHKHTSWIIANTGCVLCLSNLLCCSPLLRGSYPFASRAALVITCRPALLPTLAPPTHACALSLYDLDQVCGRHGQQIENGAGVEHLLAIEADGGPVGRGLKFRGLICTDELSPDVS
jgi:hypothetical protein